MNKLLVSAAMAAMFGAAVPAAQAATVGPTTFNVTVTLTSVCTMGTIGNLAFGTYVAFGGAVTAAPTIATLTCTRGLTGVTAAFDTNAGIGATAATTAPQAVGAGVISGLQYDITATVGGTGTSAGTSATASTTGTAAIIAYTIAGTMPASQAGTTSTGVQTQARTLTVTY